KVLEVAGYSGMKDGMHRHLFTLHSFRRFTKTILSDNISAEYSEWFLGHSKSPYWTRDPEHKKAEYIRIMKYLTFLDYTTLEAEGKSVEAQLSAKNQEIEALKQGQQDLNTKLERLATIMAERDAVTCAEIGDMGKFTNKNDYVEYHKKLYTHW